MVDSRDENGGGNGRGGEQGRNADGAGSGIAGQKAATDHDADQKAAEVDLGTAGIMAMNTAAITIRWLN